MPILSANQDRRRVLLRAARQEALRCSRLGSLTRALRIAYGLNAGGQEVPALFFETLPSFEEMVRSETAAFAWCPFADGFYGGLGFFTRLGIMAHHPMNRTQKF